MGDRIGVAVLCCVVRWKHMRNLLSLIRYRTIVATRTIRNQIRRRRWGFPFSGFNAIGRQWRLADQRCFEMGRENCKTPDADQEGIGAGSRADRL